MAKRKKPIPKGATEASDTPYDPRTMGPRLDPARRERKLEAIRANHPGIRHRANRRQRNALIALATLGAAAGTAVGSGLVRRAVQRPIEEAAFLDFQRGQREIALQEMADQAARKSMEFSIQQNLANLERSAPDLYATVAAGRRLPQGAVVLGGGKRVDLLQELGRSMAEGQFGQ